MGIACRFGFHDWDGCKCTRCRKTRNEGHTWDGCICATCGTTRDEKHDWSENQEKCARCGRTRIICVICGAELETKDAEEHKARCLIHREICDLPADAVLLVVAREAERIISGWPFSGGGAEEETARLGVLELYVWSVGRIHDDDRLAALHKQIDDQRMNALRHFQPAVGLSLQRIMETSTLGLVCCSAMLLQEAFSKNELDSWAVADHLAKLVTRALWLAQHFGFTAYNDLGTELMADLSSVGRIAQEHGWTQNSVINAQALGELMISSEQVLQVVSGAEAV